MVESTCELWEKTDRFELMFCPINSESLGSISSLSLGKDNSNDSFWGVVGHSEIRYIQCWAFSRLKISMFLVFTTYSLLIINRTAKWL